MCPGTQTFDNSTDSQAQAKAHTDTAGAPDVLLALNLQFLLGPGLIDINCPRDRSANTAAWEHQTLPPQIEIPIVSRVAI